MFFREHIKRVFHGIRVDIVVHCCLLVCRIYVDRMARVIFAQQLPNRSHIGAHSDSLSSIGPQAIVAAVSLGAKRVFTVQEGVPWGTKPPTPGDLTSGKTKVTTSIQSTIIVSSHASMPHCQELRMQVLGRAFGVTRKESAASILRPSPRMRCTNAARHCALNAGIVEIHACLL